jgi:hypothetical protein
LPKKLLLPNTSYITNTYDKIGQLNVVDSSVAAQIAVICAGKARLEVFKEAGRGRD